MAQLDPITDAEIVADYYQRFIYGWKLVKCTACNGSGHYDHHGAPKCGACAGSGKTREKP